MTRSIDVFLTRTGGPPYRGSVGYVNDVAAELVAAQGWKVNAFQLPEQGPNEGYLPFGLAARHASLARAGRPDVALYDCAGTIIRTPNKAFSDRHMVLYHGLVYGPGNWLTNPDVDLHCANSPYLARVLRALFAYPDWRNRRVLNPAGLSAVTDLRLPLPCVEHPDGHPGFAHGMDLPAELSRLVDSGVTLGHALQPDKQDIVATASIMYWLNQIARESGSPRVVLLISESSLTPNRRQALDTMLAGSGFTCADLFIPVPHLNQRALVRVVRACRFGLSYNRFPEPFGFYVLESVYQGCPVYTNGAGNNRFLLPEGHGIHVLETPGMVTAQGGGPEPDAHRAVAHAIHAGMADGAVVADECARGRRLIAEKWSLANFNADLEASFERLMGPHPPAVPFEELTVGLSPLVRSLDLDSGVSFNDYLSTVLSPEERGVIRDLVDKRCEQLPGAELEGIEARYGLFARGLLSLQS